MGFWQLLSVGQKTRRKLNSWRSTSSLSTNSDIDMADFRKCSSSGGSQYRTIESFDDNNLGGGEGFSFGSLEPSTIDPLDKEDSSLDDFDEKLMSDDHSDSINESVNHKVCHNNDNDSIGSDTHHLDLSGKSNNELIRQKGASQQQPIKKTMIVGPFGGTTGSKWDDGVGYCGIKTIKLRTGWLLDSITIEYIDQNGDKVEITHGGTGGGDKHRMELDYPSEYILSFWGYYGRLGEGDDISIRSLTFQTNIKTHGPFGPEEGKYFNLPTTGGKVVGFHGRNDHFLKAIGAYMELP